MDNIKDKKINDKIQKQLANESVNELLSITGIKSNVIQPLTVEYVDVADTRIADYVGLEENDSIRLLEFHTGAPNENLDFKMFDYSSMIYKKYRKPVNAVAICTERINEPEGKLGWGDRNKYYYDIVTYKDIDGELELNILGTKINSIKSYLHWRFLL